MEKLDVENEKLKELLSNFPEDERILNSIIENYKSRLQLLKQLKVIMNKKASYNLEYKGSFTSFSKPNNLEISSRDSDYTSEKVSEEMNKGGALVDLKLSHSTLNIK